MSKQLIYGNEPYLINQYRNRIDKSVELPLMNLLRSAEFGEQELQFVMQAPFCGEKRVLILDMPQLKINAELESYLSDEMPTTDIFVFVEDIDKRTKAFKLFKKEEVVVYNKVAKDVLDKTVLQYIKNKNARITSGAYKVLLERLNYYDSEDINLYSVIHALKRLCYAGEITEERVVSMVQDNAKENIFHLISLMIQGNNVQLFKEANLIIKNKDNNCIAVLSLLLRSLRLVYKAQVCKCSLSEMGVNYKTQLPILTAEQAYTGMNVIQEHINGIKQGRYISETAFLTCLARLCELIKG